MSWSTGWILICIEVLFLSHPLFFSSLFLHTLAKKRNLSRKQTSPFVDGSPAIRLFAFVYFHTSHAAKWKVWETVRLSVEQDEEREKSVLLKANERTNEQGGGSTESVPLFLLHMCCSFSSCSKSMYRRKKAIGTEKDRKRRREKGERKEKKKERRTKSTHTYYAPCTLDNYDLWPRCLYVENIILSKDNRCHRHWLIVNKK